MRTVALRSADGTVRAHALVDDADWHEVDRYRWLLTSDGYVARWDRASRTLVRLHRELFGLRRGDGVEVDHANGDRLDNRRHNLRRCTGAQNQQNRPRLAVNNTSGRRGVAWDRSRGKWLAYARLDGRQHNLGRYDDVDEAAATAARFRAEHMPFSAEAAA